jgi:flagellin
VSLRIAHNVEAMSAHRSLGASADRLAVSMKRLATGLRINSAADDAAGLGISERMRGQIRGLEQANRNVQDGMAMLQMIDGVLDQVTSILHRARDLAVQHNNGTLSFDDKIAIRNELAMLSDEISRIESSTRYNGIAVLSSDVLMTFQVGANNNEFISVSLIDLMGGNLQPVKPGYFFTVPWIDAGIQGFDWMIRDVAAVRSRFGAAINRLEHAYNTNSTTIENLTASESRIRDVDMAQEVTRMSREQILQQSGITALMFAQQTPSRVLDLLR